MPSASMLRSTTSTELAHAGEAHSKATDSKAAAKTRLTSSEAIQNSLTFPSLDLRTTDE